MKLKSVIAAGAALWLVASAAWAQEAEIRKNFAARLPGFPPIDDIRKSPMPGVWEVRIGVRFFYTDAEGAFAIEGGELVDLRTRKNLTQERIDAVTAIKFADLPLADALVFKQGKGTRKLAVFSDPFCGYCRGLERDLVMLKDVTIYTFLLPSISQASLPKSKEILCAKEPAVAWRALMIDGVQPPDASADCLAKQKAPERVLAFGGKYYIQSTPTIVFEDGLRTRGAMPLAMIEERLAGGKAPAK
jgi:thiol:disulfide interchange protein DsbC